MARDDRIQLFENKRIRTAWDAEKEECFFSIVDVVAVLTDQPDQRGASNYWAKLKQRLKEEGADQLLTNCQQLKLKSPKDGKRYNTDVADTESRAVQALAGTGRPGSNRGNHRSGANNRPRVGNLSQERLQPRMDQPAPASHSGAQGTDRRMGCARRTKRR